MHGGLVNGRIVKNRLRENCFYSNRPCIIISVSRSVCPITPCTSENIRAVSDCANNRYEILGGTRRYKSVNDKINVILKVIQIIADILVLFKS